MKFDEEILPDNPSWEVQSDRVLGVLHGLHIGDISECKAPDVTHACEVLTHVLQMEEARPGIVGEMFSMLIPFFIRQTNHEKSKEMALKKADAEGIGKEWRAAMAAAAHPNQKDLLARMVDVERAQGEVTQADAIRAVATVMKRDVDDVRRTVNRQNASAQKNKSNE